MLTFKASAKKTHGNVQLFSFMPNCSAQAGELVPSMALFALAEHHMQLDCEARRIPPDDDAMALTQMATRKKGRNYTVMCTAGLIKPYTYLNPSDGTTNTPSGSSLVKKINKNKKPKKRSTLPCATLIMSLNTPQIMKLWSDAQKWPEWATD